MTAVVPQLPGGPCTLWVTGEEVFEAWGAAELPSPPAPEDLDVYALMASEVLFEASARQFNGECEALVRPCRLGCGCWGDDWGILNSSWFWGYGSIGYGPAAWGWGNQDGQTCGCGCEARLKLAGYPVTAITEVMIGADVIDPSEYELQEQRYLARFFDDSVDPPLQRFWPTCQNLNLPLGQPATWSVQYTFGSPPPEAGRQAALELAWQFFLAIHNPGECMLPTGVTQVVRQGVTITRVLPMFLAGQRTGLILTDAFLGAYNPNGLRRRAAVWSPDIKYPRRIT